MDARVLVSAGSAAGLAAADWMNRLGYRVTLIEVASGLRKGATPMDIQGETIGVLGRRAMMDGVRTKALSRCIKHLEDELDDVVLTFSDGSRCRYALVFGCHGNQSGTRRLAIEGRDDFSYFMGGYGHAAAFKEHHDNLSPFVEEMQANGYTWHSPT